MKGVNGLRTMQFRNEIVNGLEIVRNNVAQE